LNDKIKEGEMIRGFSTHGENRNAYRMLVQSQKVIDHYGELEIGGRTILRWILET
jgi:hypothetical protein